MKETAQELYKQELTKKYGFKIVKNRDNDCWWLSRAYKTVPHLPCAKILVDGDKLIVSAIVNKNYTELIVEDFSFRLLNKLLNDEKR